MKSQSQFNPKDWRFRKGEVEGLSLKAFKDIYSVALKGLSAKNVKALHGYHCTVSEESKKDS